MKNSKLKPHHHIKITKEMRLDLEMWLTFLEHPSVYARPFMDFAKMWNAQEIMFYTDASMVFGLGGICDSNWMSAPWGKSFLSEKKPSIEYLELFAVLAVVLSWINLYKNKRIVLFCDNQGVVEMINTTSSMCKNCMVLTRLLVLESLIQNVRIFAKHVQGVDNDLSDSLSRGNSVKFATLAQTKNLVFNKYSTPVPECI